MTTATEVPIPAEQVTLVPANEVSWEDLSAIFGTSDAGRGQCQRFKVVGLDLARLDAARTDRDAPGSDRLW